MINELPALKTPDWLAGIDVSDGKKDEPFPLANILRDSLYYPACGFNGTPVKFLAGNILSFVYADDGVAQAEFLKNHNGTDSDCGFKGYRVVLQHEIFRVDVMPDCWTPSILPQKTDGCERILEVDRKSTPLGHWSVWKREESADASVGPELFSFLYMFGEISAIYQGLYCRLGIAPKVIAIIQPGAMGGEWEDTSSDESFFKQVVRSNVAGLPEYLLYGGTSLGRMAPTNDPYPSPCWREYRGERLCQLSERYAGLWRLNRRK